MTARTNCFTVHMGTWVLLKGRLEKLWTYALTSEDGISTEKSILCTLLVFLDRRCEVASSSTWKYSLFALMRAPVVFSPPPPHSPPKGSIHSFQHSCWITSGPFFSPFGKNTERLTGLCKWKLCGNTASVPPRVQPEMKQAPQQKHQVHPVRSPTSKKSQKGGEHHTSVSQQQHMWGNRTPPTGGSEVLQADEYIKGLLLWTVQSFSCCFNAACPVFLLSVTSVERVSCWILRPWMAQRPHWKG